MMLFFTLWACSNSAPEIRSINDHPTRNQLYLDGEAWEPEWVSPWSGDFDGSYDRYLSLDLFEGVNDIRIDFKDPDGDAVEIVWMEAPGYVDIDSSTGVGTITLDYDPSTSWDDYFEDFGFIGIVDEHGSARSYWVYAGLSIQRDYDTADTGW